MHAMEKDESDTAPEVMSGGNMPKSFLSFLAEQQSGAVVGELSESVRNVSEAIENHFEKYRGKVTGEITIKIRMTLEGGAYSTHVEHASKLPKAPAAKTIMWLGPDGNLHIRDPRQLTMPFARAPHSA